MNWSGTALTLLILLWGQQAVAQQDSDLKSMVVVRRIEGSASRAYWTDNASILLDGGKVRTMKWFAKPQESEEVTGFSSDRLIEYNRASDLLLLSSLNLDTLGQYQISARNLIARGRASPLISGEPVIIHMASCDIATKSGRVAVGFLRHLDLKKGRVLGSISVWDKGFVKPLFTKEGFSVVSDVALTGDGDRVAVLDGARFHVFTVATGESLKAPASLDASQIAFSPDGKVLAVVRKNEVRLYDTQSWKELRAFKGHTAPIQSAFWSEDGNWFITASEDKSATVWNAGTGKAEVVLRAHSAEVRFASIAPDGRHVMTVSKDGTIWIWGPESEALEMSLLQARWDYDAKNYAAALAGFKKVMDAQQGKPGDRLRLLAGSAAYASACVHALQKRRGDALKLLEKAAELGVLVEKDSCHGTVREHMLQDPDLASLRDEARFKTLAKSP